MNRRMTSLFLTVVMIATAFAGVVPMGVISVPPVSVYANGPYGTQRYPYYEGDKVTFTASIFSGNIADYKFRWDVTGDGEFDGPGSAPDYWGTFGENGYTHLFLDNNIGLAKVEAWDGVSMKTLTSAGTIWDEKYPGGGYMEAGYYGAVGMKFEVSTTITIDELGVCRSYYPYQYYNLRLWDPSTQTLLREVTDPSVPSYQWSWFPIAPITIPAGEYVLSVGFRGYYQYGDDNPGATSDGIINPIEGVRSYNNYNAFPSQSMGGARIPFLDVKYNGSYQIPDVIEDTADIWVDNVSPTIFDVTATPNPQYEGIPIEFTASFYDPGLDDSWEYRWGFGDGTYSDWFDVDKASGGASVLFVHTWIAGIGEIRTALINELGMYPDDPNGYLTKVDQVDMRSEVPDLDFMLGYNTVIVGTNYGGVPRAAMGDRLAEYSEAGGNVITMWLSEGSETKGLQGRWMDEDFNILDPTGRQFATRSMGTVYDPGHPIMNGVGTVTTTLRQAATDVEDGATRLADFQIEDYVLAGYRDVGHHGARSGRIVGLNMFPRPAYSSDDYMTLLGNAVKWACREGPPQRLAMPIHLDPVFHGLVSDKPKGIMSPTEIDVRVEVRDDDHEGAVPLGIPQPVDFQDFETGIPFPSSWPAGWYESGAGGWNRTTKGYLPDSYGYRAQHDWFCLGESSLNSPIYDFTSLEGIIVEWDQFVWADRSGGDSDGYVEVSSDGGATWNIIHEWHHPFPQTTSHEIGVWGGTAGSSQVQLRFRCYMDNDRIWEVDNINITTAEVYTMEGLGSASTTVTILPHNPPIANAGGPFYSGFEGNPITLDASASIDPEGNPLQYRWDFDSDGTWDTDWSNNPIINYTYPDDYNGLVIVEVTDGYYLVNASAGVTIFNVPPEANISFEPENPFIIVNFTGSFFDPGSDSHTFTWDFGDGTILTGNLEEQHMYIKKGFYTVKLEVCDDDGGIGIATTTVFVSGPSFLVDAGGNGDFLTIQEAVNAAQPYDLILVNSGTYTENVVISKPLSLCGMGAGSTIIDGGGITHGLTIASSNISVSRFTICNSSGFGVKIESGPANLYYMNISDNDRGVGIMNGSGFLSIHDNWIHDNQHEGIYIENWTANPYKVHIQFNRIEDNGHYGIHIENISSALNEIIIQYNRDSESNYVSSIPNGIYGHIKGFFIHNSDNVTIKSNTIQGYSEFGILDLGNKNDHNYNNEIRCNLIDGLNRAGTVGIVTQFVYERGIRQNNIINNGWWGLKSLSPSYIYFCTNWNTFIYNGHNLPPGGEFPSNWPDPTQGNTSCGGAFYFDPPPGAKIPEYLFDGNILIDNPIGIMVEGATDKLILSNNTIKESEIAIFVESGDPIIENNRLKNNVEAINIAIGSPVIQGNIIDHNKVGITIDIAANPKIGENVLVHNDVDIITPSPKSLIAYARDLLEDAKTGNKKIDKRIDGAIDRIQMSLNIDPKHPNKPWKKYPLWEDEDHLDTQHGKKIFDNTKWAVKELKNLIEKEDAPQSVKDTWQVAIDILIKADDLLAHIAYEEAQAYIGDKKVDKELEKCKSGLVRAPKDLDHTKKDGTPEPKYGQAIDHYKKAWEHTQLAIKFAGK
jgi:hypothetical protein